MTSLKEKRRQMLLEHLFKHIRHPQSHPYEEPPVYMHPATLGAGKLGQLIIVHHARDHHFKKTC